MIFKPKYLTISGWGLLILGGDQPFLVGEFCLCGFSPPWVLVGFPKICLSPPKEARFV